MTAVARIERRGTFVATGGRSRREVALTFDDGPGPYTVTLLRALERERAPATFFQVGAMIRYFPDAERALRRDRAAVLADHTESHSRLVGTSEGFQTAQVDGTLEAQRSARIRRATLFRPPYGLWDATTERVLQRHQLLMVLWTIDSRDYLRPGAPAIANRVLELVRPGAIVLMHDAGGDRTQTIAALPTLIATLRRRGYRLVTVPRLLVDDPPPRHQRRPRIGVG